MTLVRTDDIDDTGDTDNTDDTQSSARGREDCGPGLKGEGNETGEAS
jgi:hypothetical protein